MFYTATISGVLTFGMTCWGGNASKQDKNRVDRNSQKAGFWGGGEKARKHRHSLSSTSDKLRTVVADETHRLRPDFDNRHIESIIPGNFGFAISVCRLRERGRKYKSLYVRVFNDLELLRYVLRCAIERQL